MINLFSSNHCLSHELASYFADYDAPKKCGHCSVCQGYIAKLPEQKQPELDLYSIKNWLIPFIKACKIKELTSILTIKTMTRFLCGLSTPLLTEVKASKMEGFAQLKRLSFTKVMNFIESHKDELSLSI